MNLDRSLIKSQAKELIKGNVFKLFIIIFVVTLLAEGTSIFSAIYDVSDYIPNGLNSSSFDNYDREGDLENDIDEYDFDNFENYNDIDDSSIDDFTDEFSNEIIGGADNKKSTGVLSSLSGIANIVILFLAPLAITLAGVFYQLIKGNNLSWEDEFSYVFGKTFDKNYWSKFLLNLLKGIFMVLLFCLFIIPGIVFYYKYYFTSYVLAEKPELSWKDAMKISKKMTNGHKGELFVLDLSFIWWYLLCGITFGLASIYVLPYIYTTQALYYENFKIRAFQMGEMSEFDYLTEIEKAAIVYPNGTAQQNGYYQPPQQQNTQGNYYQPPQENIYQPSQENYYQPPQENVYQPPVENPSYNPVDYTYERAENPLSSYDEPENNEE